MAKNRLTRQEAKMEVVQEDTSKLTACPKCGGILKWGIDPKVEDSVSCLYCGWLPNSRLTKRPPPAEANGGRKMAAVLKPEKKTERPTNN